MRQPRIFIALICTLILQLIPTALAFSAETSPITFTWSDNQSNELNRTFYEGQDDTELGDFSIDAVTQGNEWNLKQVTLEKKVNESWKYVTASFFFNSNPKYGFTASFYGVDPLCGIRTWCSGKHFYRLMFGETVLNEFTVNFVPKKSNLKIKLATDREQAWGTMHSLKVTTTPKVSITCTVERDYENIGELKVKNGAGYLKFRALTKQKPASGRAVVNLYTVCKSTKYYGASELGFALFVP